MGLFDSTVPFKGQKYSDIKSNCIKKGALFVDPVFPPNGSSLYFSRQAPSDIKWKRPKEIVPDPHFFTDGVSADDFSQGSLGNCWFVAACACLAEDQKLWKKIVPDYEDQEWSEKNKYAGIFHFKFWRCGKWIDVVIDDYLPTRNGHLIFVHSNTRNEFWSALLEKAYAKLAGDYESLIAGNAKEALVDMTGGAGERITMSEYTTEEQLKDLFRILRHSKENHSLMSASIAATANDMEDVLPCGLVKGHAYSVTAVKKIKLGTGLMSIFSREKLRMMRLRNPWGGTEWKGAWSDSSPEWKKVSDSQKKELGLTFDENGEFWMSFEDFCTYFTSLDICHMINTSFFSFQKTWRESQLMGAWSRPNRCGGCGNHNSFLDNPQYIFDINQDEEEVMISLEQEDKRVLRDRGAQNYTIGFTVMKADINRKYRMHDRLTRISSGPFVQSRSVFNRIKLQRGRHLIIPSTFDPGQTGQYVMRMYGGSSLDLVELIYDEPQPPKCCGGAKTSATQITLVKGEGLEGQDIGNNADPYCIVKCEGRKVETRVIKNTRNPEWNERVTMYRKKAQQDIIIEVWNSNILRDEFMGFAKIDMKKRNNYRGGNMISKYPLYEEKNKQLVQKPGGLWLKILHTENMSSV